MTREEAFMQVLGYAAFLALPGVFAAAAGKLWRSGNRGAALISVVITIFFATLFDKNENPLMSAATICVAIVGFLCGLNRRPLTSSNE